MNAQKKSVRGKNDVWPSPRSSLFCLSSLQGYDYFHNGVTVYFIENYVLFKH